MSNVAVDNPTPITTVDGTITLALLLERPTSTPLAAAGAASVTVAVTDRPLPIEGTDRVNPCRVRRVTFNVTVWLTPAYVAVSVAVDDVAAATVSIENVWLVDPAATSTLAGMVATGVLLASETTAPPVGAAADSVTVPVTCSPPAIDWLDNEIDSRTAVELVGEVVDDDAPLHAHERKTVPIAIRVAIHILET